MLAAGAAGVENVLAIIVRLQIDFHVLRLGHDGHGGGRGVDAALGLGFRHALHAVAAALELQLAEDALAFEAQDDLLEAAQLGRRHVEHLDLPAVVLGVVLVHFVQIAGKQGRFFAAGAGADFQHAAGAVGVLAADGHVQQIVPERFALVLEPRQLGCGQFAQIGDPAPSAISIASRIWLLSSLNRRYFVASLASEPCSRATAVSRAGLA